MVTEEFARKYTYRIRFLSVQYISNIEKIIESVLSVYAYLSTSTTESLSGTSATLHMLDAFPIGKNVYQLSENRVGTNSALFC